MASDAGDERTTTAPMLGPTTEPTTPEGDGGQALGARLGRYLVLDEIGKGGMGVVYAAYDPVLDRRVALKLVRPGRRARRGIKARDRLLREAQSLARLSHPNVVTVHDVGWLGDELFIAMELVEGQSLRRWLRASERDPAAILSVFSHAAHGLEAAHAAGVVHRDFKPDNVLVTDSGRVVVVDFGLSALVEGGEGDSGELGSGGYAISTTVMGTPAYMAPEQQRGDPTDARTDQFSFCVSLYEALAGARPPRRVSPPSPASPAMADTTATAGEGQAAGGAPEAGPTATVDDATLAPPPLPGGVRVPARVRRALERGLAHDPAARWPSMAALRGELEPRGVRAGRRGVAVVLSAAVLGAIIGATALARDDAAARCRAAPPRLAEAWDARREQVRTAFAGTGLPYASVAFERAAAGLDAHLAAWRAAHRDACEATNVRGEQSPALLDLRMGCLNRNLERVTATVEVLAEADAEIVVRALRVVGELPDVAACADTERLLAAGQEDGDIADELRERLARKLARAQALKAAGRPLPALEEARAVLDEARARGAPYLATRALIEVGELEADHSRYAEARGALDEAILEAIALGRDDLAADALIEAVGVIGYLQGEHAAGDDLVRRARAYARRLGDEPERGARLEVAAALLAGERGQAEEAAERYQRAFELLSRAPGEHHARIATVMQNLGYLNLQRGRYGDALSQFRMALAETEAVLGADHPELASIHLNLGVTLEGKGELEQAEMHHRRSLALNEAAYGRRHRLVAKSLYNLGVLEAKRGNLDRAQELQEEAMAIREGIFGADHLEVAISHNALAYVAELREDLDDALRHYQRALDIRLARLGEKHPSVAFSSYSIANLLLKQERTAEAIAAAERSLALLEAAVGEEHPNIALPLMVLSDAHRRAGRPARAIPLLERAMALVDDEHSVELAGELRFLFARVLDEARSSPRKAETLARRARELYARAGDEGRVQQVDEWLAAR